MVTGESYRVSTVEIPGPNTERTCSGVSSQKHEKPKEQVAMESTSVANAEAQTQCRHHGVAVTWRMTAQGTGVESSSHTAEAIPLQCTALI